MLHEMGVSTQGRPPRWGGNSLFRNQSKPDPRKPAPNPFLAMPPDLWAAEPLQGGEVLMGIRISGSAEEALAASSFR
jgi:hypothetical protein